MMWLRQKFVLSFRITYDDGFVWYADTESWFNLSSPKGGVYTRDDTQRRFLAHNIAAVQTNVTTML